VRYFADVRARAPPPARSGVFRVDSLDHLNLKRGLVMFPDPQFALALDFARRPPSGLR